MRKLFLILYLTLTLAACSEVQSEPGALEPTWNAKIRKFSNCQEIDSYLQSYTTTKSGVSDAAAEHFQPQVAGVEEGDILQSDSSYYYFARSGSIEVVDRKKLTNIKSIAIPSMPFNWIFVSNQKLISVTGDYQKTWVQTFDESNQFASLSLQEFVGQPIDFRFSNGDLILVTKSYRNVAESVGCSQVYRPNLEDGSYGMTLVHKIPVQSTHEASQTLTLWGQADFFYMTKDEIFLFQNLPWLWQQRTSSFRTVSWSSGSLSFNQAESFDGYLMDRSAVHQTGSHLLIAVTASLDQDGTSSLFNQLSSYKKDPQGKYQWLKSTQPFGQNEDIRAVRFMKDKAYVVTFEKTDPLFVLDIKDPANIQIMSELKAPGFSTQLMPLSDKQLFGIGFDAIPDAGFSWFDGIKVSLFNTEDPLSITETNSLKFGDRGSYSEAAFSTKGLFVSKKGDQLLVPLVEIATNPNQYPGDFGTNHLFSGAVLLEVQDQLLVEKSRFTHKVWRESNCGSNAYNRLGWWSSATDSLDIQRALIDNACVDTFSRFGVMRFCNSSNTPTTSIEFGNSLSQCGNSTSTGNQW